ncbi:unnamed protein product [Paramecium octaurelia]|uniref:Galectin n=1 Tax=Paramecium octaurelia TaxID=43137 RepID=A0A8S1RZN8_PAROT|nr:unnamed protein product [Paramecium octaurelia]CAD8185106.1 unnamed protein product [Paramecium octaurelia]
MIIIFILISITRQTIIYEFNANSQTKDGWEGSSNFDTCVFYYSRIFLDLEPHSHITVNAQFISIDSNPPTQFYIDSKIQIMCK